MLKSGAVAVEFVVTNAVELMNDMFLSESVVPPCPQSPLIFADPVKLGFKLGRHVPFAALVPKEEAVIAKGEPENI